MKKQILFLSLGLGFIIISISMMNVTAAVPAYIGLVDDGSASFCCGIEYDSNTWNDWDSDGGDAFIDWWPSYSGLIGGRGYQQIQIGSEVYDTDLGADSVTLTFDLYKSSVKEDWTSQDEWTLQTTSATIKVHDFADFTDTENADYLWSNLHYVVDVTINWTEMAIIMETWIESDAPDNWDASDVTDATVSKFNSGLFITIDWSNPSIDDLTVRYEYHSSEGYLLTYRVGYNSDLLHVEGGSGSCKMPLRGEDPPDSITGYNFAFLVGTSALVIIMIKKYHSKQL